MVEAGLPADTHIGAVHLRVADLARSLAFYRDLLGLRLIEEAQGTASLSATGAAPALVVLHESPGARPRPQRATGLYHFAILLPERRALARLLLRLAEHRWPLQGASDHAVSEALYLADPDGNGVELYVDRPRAAWRWERGEVSMHTRPLDVGRLLAEAAEDREPWEGIHPETVIGHIHLHVSDLREAERFYHGLFGFDVVVRGYPGALFLSAGGYHHHLGVNTWAGRDAARPPEDAAGLLWYEVVVPGEAARERLYERLRREGASPVPVAGGWRVDDADGNGIVVRG